MRFKRICITYNEMKANSVKLFKEFPNINIETAISRNDKYGTN